MDNESSIFKKISNAKAPMYVPKMNEYIDFEITKLEGFFSVLHFHSGAFTPSVLQELKCFVEKSKAMIHDEYNLVSISCDNPSALKAFSRLSQAKGGLGGLSNVLVADRTGEICKALQVYDERNHRAFPSYIILDKDMKIVAKFTGDHNVSLNPEQVLDVLKQVMTPTKAKTKHSEGEIKKPSEVSGGQTNGDTDKEEVKVKA